MRTLLRQRLADPLNRHVAWVAATYILLNLLVIPFLLYYPFGLSTDGRRCGLWECFYFSIVTCTTLGYGDIWPTTTILQVVTIGQVLASLFVVIFWLSYVFATHGDG